MFFGFCVSTSVERERERASYLCFALARNLENSLPPTRRCQEGIMGRIPTSSLRGSFSTFPSFRRHSVGQRMIFKIIKLSAASCKVVVFFHGFNSLKIQFFQFRFKICNFNLPC